MKELEAIASLLSKRVGFDAKIIGDRKISKAIQARQSLCDLPDISAYCKTLQQSPEEFDQLVEQLVVPETWFFRDRKPFDFLIKFVRSEWLPKSGGSKLQVLSVPCSTGEEPYSIAIALLEAGLNINQFSVDAVDISQQALDRARQAIYSKNSFRGEDWVDRNRYFQLTNDRYTVCPNVRNAVKFRQGNLLNELDLIKIGLVRTKYDIIFCRNLLIYLENSACQQILNKLHFLLVSQGLLFVGAAEMAKVPGDRFSYLRQSFTFAYRKIDGVPSPPSSNKKTEPILDREKNFVSLPIQNRFSGFFPVHSLQHHSAKSSHLPSVAKSPPEAACVSDLDRAKHLADVGHLAAAIACCKTYLESHSIDVEAYTLLGTLYQATTNDEQAERCFQKALYLEPDCYEALMHLALLKEARGDEIGAKHLQQRIQKLQANF